MMNKGNPEDKKITYEKFIEFITINSITRYSGFDSKFQQSGGFQL